MKTETVLCFCDCGAEFTVTEAEAHLGGTTSCPACEAENQDRYDAWLADQDEWY